MNKFLAIVLLGLSGVVSAQTVETTPNLITSGSGAWTGATNSTTIGGGFSGGNTPAYNSSNNVIYFGYNQATVAQTIAINNALQGSGVQVGGYNYSWMYLNNSSTGGTLSSTIKLTSPTGTTLEQYNYAMNTVQDGWRTVSGSQNFNQQYGLANVGNLSIEFTGKDARWWAGYYGPQVKDVNLSLNYTVDPCTANPLYSPNCAGYNNVINSQTMYAQSYAINQALSNVGAGVQINGFKYGYDLYVGGDWCSATFLGIFCTQTSQSSMAVDVNVTSNTGSVLYSQTHNHNEQNTFGSYSYSYVFPSQRSPSSMGNFSLTPRQYGTGAMYSSWSNWQYTPDPCTTNPLSSTSCAGYQQAFTEQQCASNPLYSTQCAGYAAAYFTQQCNANQLYNQGCPGYAAAYLTLQCSSNPLYSTTCVGYQQAYHDQQCSISPLYATDCPGYQQAYFSQQCTADSLYSTQCPNYASAYKAQQCSLNALYATDCPGYAQAYFSQQCNLNGLYDQTCPNYSTAYAKKMVLEQQGLASTVATAGVIASTAPVSTTTVSSEGTVSTAPSSTGNTTVDKAIAAPAPSANSAASPAAVVQLAPPPPAPAAQAPQERKPEGKPEGGGDKQGGDKPAGGPSQMAQGPQGGGDKPAQPTARQQLAERRAEAAKKDAVEKGKNLANEMGKAADMESQKQIQNVVIQAMGFTPGFDSYGKSVVPDVVGYKPFTVYNNQKNVDSRANLRMWGGTDRLHNEMVDSQYNKEK